MVDDDNYITQDEYFTCVYNILWCIVSSEYCSCKIIEWKLLKNDWPLNVYIYIYPNSCVLFFGKYAHPTIVPSVGVLFYFLG